MYTVQEYVRDQVHEQHAKKNYLTLEFMLIFSSFYLVHICREFVRRECKFLISYFLVKKYNTASKAARLHGIFTVTALALTDPWRGGVGRGKAGEEESITWPLMEGLGGVSTVFFFQSPRGIILVPRRVIF